MLEIRSEQLRILGGAARSAFEADAINHFFEYYPHECGRAGREQVTKLVRLGIERALVHGYTKQREVILYINLMMILGSGFDRDPQIPWVARQLNDLSFKDSFERIQRTFSSTLKYLADCYGPKNGEMVKTLVRLRDSHLELAPQSEGIPLRGDICKLLEFFAPRKFAVDGETAVRALVEEAIWRSLDYGIRGACGVTVYASLMFLLGVDFDSDPMYAWAGEILRGRAPGDEDARVGQLYAAALRYVNTVLSE